MAEWLNGTTTAPKEENVAMNMASEEIGAAKVLTKLAEKVKEDPLTPEEEILVAAMVVICKQNYPSIGSLCHDFSPGAPQCRFRCDFGQKCHWQQKYRRGGCDFEDSCKCCHICPRNYDEKFRGKGPQGSSAIRRGKRPNWIRSVPGAGHAVGSPDHSKAMLEPGKE